MSRPPRFGLRTPWMLPIILAILIVLLVLGVIFGSRIKSALNSPTSTPNAVVVTATPAGATGPATATPNGGTVIPATATPSSRGVSTAVPHGTPPPTVVGLQLGAISRPQHEVDTIQTAADKGDPKYTYYLDPRMVVQNTLAHFGFTQPFQITSPNPAPTPTPHPEQSTGRPLIDFIVTYQGKEYTAVAAQPGVKGAKGIWLIVTIDSGRQTI